MTLPNCVHYSEFKKKSNFHYFRNLNYIPLICKKTRGIVFTDCAYSTDSVDTFLIGEKLN